MYLLPGTVLVSRNLNESLNTSPGYWNHLAIVVNGTQLVEDQAGLVEMGQGHGVIITQLSDYAKRDYQILALQPLIEQAGRDAADRALKLVGLPNRPAASLFGRLGFLGPRRGANCVSVIQVAWGSYDRHIRRIIIPDQIMPFVGRDFREAVKLK